MNTTATENTTRTLIGWADVYDRPTDYPGGSEWVARLTTSASNLDHVAPRRREPSNDPNGFGPAYMISHVPSRGGLDVAIRRVPAIFARALRWDARGEIDAASIEVDATAIDRRRRIASVSVYYVTTDEVRS